MSKRPQSFSPAPRVPLDPALLAVPSAPSPKLERPVTRTQEEILNANAKPEKPAKDPIIEQYEAYQRGEVNPQPKAQPTAQEERVSRGPALPAGSLKTSTALTSEVVPVSERAKQGWLRVQVPSRCVPYSFTDLQVRPLDVPALIEIWGAVNARSMTMFYDALDKCVNQDVRSLTQSDFRFLMYWWRLNSFPRTPFEVVWTSRYGNECKTVVGTSAQPVLDEANRVPAQPLEIIELQMTRDEYAQWKAKGICMPTLRDAEVLSDDTLKDVDRFQLERAQYIDMPEITTDWYERRIAKLLDGGIGLLEDIRDFAGKIEHGVRETVIVKDYKFKADEAAQVLEETSSQIMRLLEEREERDAVNITELSAILKRAQDMKEEAEEIKSKLANGETPTAKEETIVLEISAMDFFPNI